MERELHRITVEGGEDSMNHSISFASTKESLDRDIMRICRAREAFRLELLKVELELLREKVRSA